jgi:hypothetical protein
MATAHSPFQPGEATFSLPSQHWPDENWSTWTDPFEVMPEFELDYWVDGFAPSDAHQQSFEHQDSSNQDALPTLGSASSPEDSNDSNTQFTPSSTANDSPGNAEHSDHTSFELVSNNTSSPAEHFEGASLMNSDFSDHSPVRQRILPASGATPSSSQQSREPSNGPNWQSREQDWSSSFGTSSEGYAPAASPYHGFVTNESTGAINDNLLADMTIPFRISQPSEPWATTALQSITWGNIQQPMFPMQQQSFGNVVPYHSNEYMGNYTLEAPVGNVSNIYAGLTPPGLHQGQQQYNHHHQLPPGPAIHNRPQQLETLPTNSSQPQVQPSSTRADLAQSTRLRYPDHPKLSAEQNPPALIPNLRPIAAASGERSTVTVLSGGTRGTRHKRGGRERNSHLNPDARDRSSKMRKKGACWRCKLQRDPVSPLSLYSASLSLTIPVPGRWFALRAVHHWITKRPAILLRLRSVKAPGLCYGLPAHVVHDYAHKAEHRRLREIPSARLGLHSTC